MLTIGATIVTSCGHEGGTRPEEQWYDITILHMKWVWMMTIDLKRLVRPCAKGRAAKSSFFLNSYFDNLFCNLDRVHSQLCRSGGGMQLVSLNILGFVAPAPGLEAVCFP